MSFLSSKNYPIEMLNIDDLRTDINTFQKACMMLMEIFKYNIRPDQHFVEVSDNVIGTTAMIGLGYVSPIVNHNGVYIEITDLGRDVLKRLLVATCVHTHFIRNDVFETPQMTYIDHGMTEMIKRELVQREATFDYARFTLTERGIAVADRIRLAHEQFIMTKKR